MTAVRAMICTKTCAPGTIPMPSTEAATLPRLSSSADQFSRNYIEPPTWSRSEKCARTNCTNVLRRAQSRKKRTSHLQLCCSQSQGVADHRHRAEAHGRGGENRAEQ